MPENSAALEHLPYNLDAEQAVLGSILIDPVRLQEVVPIVKQEYFYLRQHQVIFGAMMALFTNSNAIIDPIVIADALVKEGLYDESGGRDYLLTLKNSVASTANVITYAKIVQEQYYLRSLIHVAQNIIDTAVSNNSDASSVLEYAEQKIYDIRKGTESDDPERISSVIRNGVYDRLHKITGEEKEKYKAVPSGFGVLDGYISGLNKSDLIIVGARPTMGKTAFVLNLAQNITMTAKKKCVFFSLEMSKEQLAERLLASRAGIPSDKIRRGELSDDEWIRLGNAAGEFKDAELYLDDSSNLSVPEIKAKVRRMKDVDAVIVDYLGLLRSAVRKENRVQEVSEITRNLKMMAKDLNIPVICCSQLSRAGTEGRNKNHKPQLSDLRESGSIEQDADIVLLLYREEYYSGEKSEEDKNKIDNSSAELIVAKNRHGKTGTVDMVFDKDFTRYRCVDKNYGNDE